MDISALLNKFIGADGKANSHAGLAGGALAGGALALPADLVKQLDQQVKV